MTKLLCGIGVNDSGYNTHSSVKIGGKKIVSLDCPFYKSWRGMINRCYSAESLRKRPTYIGCSVVGEWLVFSKFKEWMETQDWRGKHLDKDLLSPGNKVYGPDTCVFVTQYVNSFTSDHGAARGEWPIGVCFDKSRGKFTATIGNGKGRGRSLGRHSSPEAAHKAWLTEKLKMAKELADTIDDKRVACAIVARYQLMMDSLPGEVTQ